MQALQTNAALAPLPRQGPSEEAVQMPDKAMLPSKDLSTHHPAIRAEQVQNADSSNLLHLIMECNLSFSASIEPYLCHNARMNQRWNQGQKCQNLAKPNVWGAAAGSPGGSQCVLRLCQEMMLWPRSSPWVSATAQSPRCQHGGLRP